VAREDRVENAPLLAQFHEVDHQENVVREDRVVDAPLLARLNEINHQGDVAREDRVENAPLLAQFHEVDHQEDVVREDRVVAPRLSRLNEVNLHEERARGERVVAPRLAQLHRVNLHEERARGERVVAPRLAQLHRVNLHEERAREERVVAPRLAQLHQVNLQRERVKEDPVVDAPLLVNFNAQRGEEILQQERQVENALLNNDGLQEERIQENHVENAPLKQSELHLVLRLRAANNFVNVGDDYSTDSEDSSNSGHSTDSDDSYNSGHSTDSDDSYNSDNPIYSTYSSDSDDFSDWDFPVNLEENRFQSLAQPSHFDVALFDTLATNAASTLEYVKDGFNKIVEESYNTAYYHFPHYFGTHYKVALEDQNDKVLELLKTAEGIKDIVASLELQLAIDEGLVSDDRIAATERVENIKNAFESVTFDLGRVKHTIDTLPLVQIPSLIKITEEEPQNITPSEEKLKSIETPSSQVPVSSSPGIWFDGKFLSGSETQPIESQEKKALDSSTSGMYRIKISGKEIVYPLKEKGQDKDKSSSEILNSTVNTNNVLFDPVNSSIKEDEKVESTPLNSTESASFFPIKEDEKVESSPLNETISVSNLLEALGSQVDVLLDKMASVNNPGIETHLMNSSLYLRKALGKTDDTSPLDNVTEELTELKLNLSTYKPSTEEVASDKDVKTWAGLVKGWFDIILGNFTNETK